MTDSSSNPRIAIIGSGLAGLTCATALKGFADVQLFEKSVFVGGRLSRYQFGEYRFNHGEQYFTVSNSLFLNIVAADTCNFPATLVALFTAPSSGATITIFSPNSGII